MYDTIIVGGGVAGLSSAIYAKSRGKKVLIIEKEPTFGGTIRNISTITHYAGAVDGEPGIELAKRMRDQVVGMGIEIIQENVSSADLLSDIKTITTSNNTYQAKTIIIAAGTTQKELPNINPDGFGKPIIAHNSFLNIDDYADKDVCVVGGSDGAAKEALYLSKHTKKVYMIVVEKELACIEQFKSQINNTDNIEVICDSSLVDVIGERHLEAIQVMNNTTKEKRTIDLLDGQIYVYIGSYPNTDWCTGIELENGYIKTNENMETNIPNVYAVGDIRTKTIRQISTAVADGTIAGIHSSK